MAEQEMTEQQVAEPSTPVTVQPQVDIDALLSKAREQEKAKLYPEIEKLKGEVKAKSDKLNAEIIKSANLEDAVAEKEKEITRLNGLIEKAKQEGKSLGEAELTALAQERDTYKAEAEKVKAEFEAYKNQQEVEAYKASKIGDIDEDFRDLVVGSTKEEIDKNYTKAKALQDKVKEKYQKVDLPSPSMAGVFGDKSKNVLESIRDYDDSSYEKIRASIFGDAGSRKF